MDKSTMLYLEKRDKETTQPTSFKELLDSANVVEQTSKTTAKSEQQMADITVPSTVEALQMADSMLAADGYKEWCYVRLAISSAIKQLEKPEQKAPITEEQIDKFIKSIPVNRANFEFMAENGIINGSLLVDLRKMIRKVIEG